MSLIFKNYWYWKLHNQWPMYGKLYQSQYKFPFILSNSYMSFELFYFFSNDHSKNTGYSLLHDSISKLETK